MYDPPKRVFVTIWWHLLNAACTPSPRSDFGELFDLLDLILDIKNNPPVDAFDFRKLFQKRFAELLSTDCQDADRNGLFDNLDSIARKRRNHVCGTNSIQQFGNRLKPLATNSVSPESTMQVLLVFLTARNCCQYLERHRASCLQRSQSNIGIIRIGKPDLDVADNFGLNEVNHLPLPFNSQTHPEATRRT